MKNGKIEIKSITQNLFAEGLEVAFDIKIRENEHKLTYKITGGVESVPVVCDSVVVTFLYYAVRHELDICSEYPISERLYYNIKKHIIPQLSIFNNTTENKIDIKMPLTKEVYSGKWVGTGVSLGVDSFTTIHEYLEEDVPQDYRITHLVHLKTGAHHGSLGYFNKEKEQELYLAEKERVINYCEKTKMNLISIESNLFEITNKEFGYNFDTSHVLRNLGCILLIQNYFNKYYYASACNLDAFFVGLNEDMAHYEKWIMPYISNESVSFYSANEDMGRVKKTKYISQFSDTYDSLHVCWKNGKNCGKCAKCIRTLVTLDILGELEKYKNSFDLEYYYENRDVCIMQILLLKKKDPCYKEIYEYMLKNKIRLPSFSARLKAIFNLCRIKLKENSLKDFLIKLKRKFIG